MADKCSKAGGIHYPPLVLLKFCNSKDADSIGTMIALMLIVMVDYRTDRQIEATMPAGDEVHQDCDILEERCP